MEEIKDIVRKLSRAVFGDPENPRGRPGIVAELATLEGQVQRVNQNLERLHRVLWAIAAAIITGVGAAVLKLVIPGA